MQNTTRTSKKTILLTHSNPLCCALPRSSGEEERAPLPGSLYLHMTDGTLILREGTPPRIDCTLRQLIFFARWSMDTRQGTLKDKQMVQACMRATEQELEEFMLSCRPRFPVILVGRHTQPSANRSTILLISRTECMEVSTQFLETARDGDFETNMFSASVIKVFRGEINCFGLCALRRHVHVPQWRTRNTGDRKLAVAMSQHKRLGKDSHLRMLDHYLLELICKYDIDFSASSSEVDNLVTEMSRVVSCN